MTKPESDTVLSPAGKRAVVDRFARHINRGQVKYLRAGHLDVLEAARKGAGFTDPASGRRLFDCFTSAGCFNVGRHNPVVMQALEEALETEDMGSFFLLSPAKAALAEKLCAVAPDGLDRLRFASGGGEAVEMAIKLARGVTRRNRVLSTVKAYHGHTGFALSANGKPHYRRYCEPLMPGFEFAPYNDLEAMVHRADVNTAAIIVEPVQGEAGIYPASREYLEGLRQLCDERGIFLIFDEIQTGFGRTGRLFACEHAGVVPDMMTVAKSLGAGLYPIAAMLYRAAPAVDAFLAHHPDFHTSYTGGTDLGCRVGLRVIEYIEEQRLCENAGRMGQRLQDALRALTAENPRIIKEVRGVGLMVGIEYVHEFMGPMMSEALARQGVFAAYSGNAPQVMRFMMPIVATEEEIDAVAEAIGAAVAHMKTLLPLALLAARVPGVLPIFNNERVQTWAFGLLRRIEDTFGRNRGGSHDG
ncbi:MAG: aspartate aminotransferase family protein [Candidatus Hydrogenedentota bacterium]